MKFNIIKIFALLLLFCASQIIHAKSEQSFTVSDLIDIAGQQRMYVHQVLVSYAQIGQVQSFGNPVSTRQNAVKKFEANLNILKAEQRLNPQLKEMQTLWNELKVIAMAPPKKKEMATLIKYNEDIVALSNKVISLLVTASNKNVINISGKQRMLSQRIALFMLMKNWGFDDNYEQQMQSSLANFAMNIIYLKKHSENTPQIDRAIKSLKKDYAGLIQILSDEQEGRDFSFSISRYTSQMLRKAKKTTKLYVELDNVPTGKEYDIKALTQDGLAKLDK